MGNQKVKRVGCIIALTLDLKEILYYVFIDYENNFDKIDISLLLEKLLNESARNLLML